MTDRDLTRFAADRRLRETTVARLRGLGEDGCAAALAVAVPLGMNDNHLRDLLDLAADIAARRGCGVAAVLADGEITALCASGSGRADRIRAVKEHLWRLRYPQLAAALQRIAELRGEMGLPGGVRLEVPEHLEGGELTVTVRAASAAQLRARVAALSRALDGAQVDAIFSIWQEAEE